MINTEILNGKQLVEERKVILSKNVDDLVFKLGRAPQLVVVLVGENQSSQIYVQNKIKFALQVGISSRVIRLSADVTQAELNQIIFDLNNDDFVDAVLVQLPLPEGLSSFEVSQNISALKDADGLSIQSLGLLIAGKSVVKPCTPFGIMNLLNRYQISLEGKRAVVVGRSQIVGIPMAQLLLQANATVTVCHSKTINLSSYTQHADLVVVAAGKKNMFGRDDFKKGAVVIDVGIHGSKNSGGVFGDVRTEELLGWVSAVTPVPGGVGPMTIMTLFENTYSLAKIRMNQRINESMN